MSGVHSDRGPADSHLLVFRNSQASCPGTIAGRMSDGWRLTGIERTKRGAYLLDFARRRHPELPQLQEPTGAVLANEHALADVVVQVIADRMSRGWRLTSIRRTEEGAYLLDFLREHLSQGPEAPAV